MKSKTPLEWAQSEASDRRPEWEIVAEIAGRTLSGLCADTSVPASDREDPHTIRRHVEMARYIIGEAKRQCREEK